jgi:hypothetical protein
MGQPPIVSLYWVDLTHDEQALFWRRRDPAPSCVDGLLLRLLLRLLVIFASPSPRVRSSETFIGVALVAISVLQRRRKRLQRSRGRFLGPPHGYGCVADDAAQRARAVAAVMTVEGSSDAEKGMTAPVLVVGPKSTVVSKNSLRDSLRLTLELIRLTRPPVLRGDSGCRCLYSTVSILLFQ